MEARKIVYQNADKCIYVLDSAADEASLSMVEALVEQSVSPHCYCEANPETVCIFIAEVSGKAVGYLLCDRRLNDITIPFERIQSFSGHESKPGKEIWSVVCIWIKDAFQSQGLGTQLCISASRLRQVTL